MAGQLDAAAWAQMGTPSHACASCGAKCRRCADGEPCAKARWCAWCAHAYAENPPAADGFVYCGGPDPDAPEAEHGCGRSLPGLARLIERGLTQYPLYCGECRDALAATPPDPPNPPVPSPELDGDAPASASDGTGRSTDERPADGDSEPEPAPARKPARITVAPQQDARQDAHARHLRGGFAPRQPPEPEQHSEMGTGQTAHPRQQYRP